MKRVMIGTAGHIDHGKTALTRALTGKDPTRHPEERSRGMSIDIGFAPLFVEPDLVVGMVDVPGHERFIRNMVAGATGIDLTLFVVAADDGVMPQTREHLQIMQILGIPGGVVALTKIDAVEPEAVALAREDVSALLAGTFLEGAPIHAVSSTTGEGIAALKAALARAAAQVPLKDSGGVFRLPVQRVFVRKGFGTIVTGVPFSGRIRAGDPVEVLPAGQRGRVRAIQAYGREASEAQAGHSVSLNLTEVDHAEVRRGDVVSTPGALHGVRRVEVSFRFLPGAGRDLADLTPVKFLVGTAEARGRLVLVGRSHLSPGETCYAQVRLAEPVVAVPGDRYILRLESPEATLGGGVVVGVSDRRLRRSRPGLPDAFAQAEAALQDPTLRVLAALASASAPADAAALARAAVMEPAVARAALAALEKSGRAHAVGKKWVHEDLWRAGAARLAERLAAFHADNPASVGAERPLLRERTRLDPDLFNALVSEALAAGTLREAEGGRLALPRHQAALSEGDASRAEALAERFRAGGFSPPAPEEAIVAVGLSPAAGREAVTLLVQKGILVRVADGLLFHKENVEAARARLVAAAEAQGEVESGRFRDEIGTTRKYAIPLLEYFDAQGLTKRVGNKRFLRKYSR